MADIKYFKGNLFETESLQEKGVMLAHCISADYKLGAGIAVEFNRRFDLKERLAKLGKNRYPDCIVVGDVFNLVTKNKYFEKPTYGTMNSAVEMMAKQAYELDVRKIVTYKLGCTRDRMKWEDVEKILREHIIRIGVDIEVYEL